MDKIRKVALFGAGAVGAYFISGFAKQKECEFYVVASGKRADRLKNQGLVINNTLYFPEVKNAEEIGKCDLVLISVKYNSLMSIVDDVKLLLHDETIVISLLNGIDSEEIIGTEIGMEHMVYSFMNIASMRKDNSITFDPERTKGVFLGEKDTKKVSVRMRLIADLLAYTPIRYNLVPDIMERQWEKFTLNIVGNLPQAVLGVGYGAYFDSEHVNFIRQKMEQEVRQVAESLGIFIGKLPMNKDTCNPGAKFSTLQDLEAGRKTEIDMFLGKFLKIASGQQKTVPYCEYTFHAIKALEEKNEGRFNYE